MTRPLRIAVGIATKGRPELLAHTLRHLAGQQRPAERVLLCPAAPPDLPAALPPGCEVVQGRVGSCAQRNAILDALRGSDIDIVLFIDDDFFPQPDYLRELERLMQLRVDAAIVRGELIADGVHGPGYGVAEAEALLAADVRPAEPALRNCLGAYGCNFAARLSVVHGIGVRFDEALPLYGWQEDIDFSRQAAPYGAVLRSEALRGVHLGHKGGRTSGLRFGYSQMANPIYLVRKGTMPVAFARRLMSRNLVSNLARSLWSEGHVDRRGRLRGNLLALLDWLRGRVHPRRILELGP